MLVITARPSCHGSTQVRPPAGVMVIDWEGVAVHMTYINNTYIIAGIQYVAQVTVVAQVTTGLVF